MTDIVNHEQSVRTLSYEEIKQAIDLLKAEFEYRPSFWTLSIRVLIGALPFFILGLVGVMLAYVRIDKMVILGAGVAAGVLWGLYHLGAKLVPESQLDYVDTILLGALGVMAVSKEELQELWRERSRISLLGRCLELLLAGLSFFACSIAWIALEVVAWGWRQVPGWLAWAAALSLVVFAIMSVLMQLRMAYYTIPYYERLVPLLSSFLSYLDQSGEARAPVEVSAEASAGLEEVEIAQSLREAVKAVRSGKWVPLRELDVDSLSDTESEDEPEGGT